MDHTPVFDRLKEIMETIEHCIASGLQLPSLILLYTTIDSVSWLTGNKSDEAVRKRFTRWVDTWLLKSNSLGCSSAELYAARCGVLHTLTSDSDLSREKKVRRILYSSGDSSPSRLQAVADHIKPNEYVAIRIEDIYQAFKTGLVDCLEQIMNDSPRRQEFEKRATRYFMYLNPGDLKAAANSIGLG